ncbi:tryptophan 2,3-dioxygenase-like [Apostichopus japonicus]|uniref:tryptophan 2,3-dioxygenase-like n=1 Tax=Stichopus japonicus TaxID=307972 RepID=UPI003AB4E0B9
MADSKVKEAKPQKILVYKDYLQLDNKILNAQDRESGRDGDPPHHDEMFFIIVHQVYELWFKSNIHDLRSVMDSLKNVELVKLNRVNEKMTRMTSIMKICVDQLHTLETLNPAEFMGFRSYLFPASGFQSYQFRIFENTFGLKHKSRSEFGRQHYKQDHPKDILKQIDTSEEEKTFVDVLESWLAKVFREEPQSKVFWEKFEKGVKGTIEDIKSKNKSPEEEQKAVAIWQSVIKKELHDKKIIDGHRKMSFDAWRGALMITYLRNRQEKYAVAHNFLNLVRDADNLLMKWRYHHVQMVHRQIGDKAGTGGTTSGYSYLKSTVGDQYRVFKDLFDFHGFLLEPKHLPDYYDL